jgi:hypothetical protein
MAADARLLAGAALADALRDCARDDAGAHDGPRRRRLDVPQQSGVNLSRGSSATSPGSPSSGSCAVRIAPAPTASSPRRAAAIAGPDAIFDSARLAHADRWRVALPSRDELARASRASSTPASTAVPRDRDDDGANYFHRLALFQLRTCTARAFAWLRATLALAGADRLRHAVASRKRADPHRWRDDRARPRAERARLRLRQRAAAVAGRRRAVRDRRDAASQRRLPSLRRRRRL